MKRSKHAVSKNFFGPFISAQAVKATIKDYKRFIRLEIVAIQHLIIGLDHALSIKCKDALLHVLI